MGVQMFNRKRTGKHAGITVIRHHVFTHVVGLVALRLSTGYVCFESAQGLPRLDRNLDVPKYICSCTGLHQLHPPTSFQLESKPQSGLYYDVLRKALNKRAIAEGVHGGTYVIYVVVIERDESFESGGEGQITGGRGCLISYSRTV